MARPKGSRDKVPRKPRADAVKRKRPVYFDLAGAARKHTKSMLGVLVDIALNEKASDAARARSADAVLDRGHGKARQAHEISLVLDLTRLTDAELAFALAIADRLEKIDRDTGRDGSSPVIDGELADQRGSEPGSIEGEVQTP